jgi:hypothetical protein
VSGRARETAASIAQYALLGGFAAVAAGISAQGLTAFARDNMGLQGPWPYLLFLSLDGAAGVCAVLLTRRAARAESGLMPRIAVWGLVAASASFNATHAPRHPGAPEAFGLMPVICAVLFEFTLRELQARTAGRADRRLGALRWAHPAERIRVQLALAADEQISAREATRRVRTDQAARRLYQLRLALRARDRAARQTAAARRVRAAERRAQAAFTRAGFADPDIAASVLRQVQVLARTPELALLDYSTAAPALAAIANLISPGPQAGPVQSQGPARGSLQPADSPDGPVSGQPAGSRNAPAAGKCGAGESSVPILALTTAAGSQDAGLDGQLVAAAAAVIAEARQAGTRLSQKAMADRLRSDGRRVANESLRALMVAAAGLAAEPAAAHSGQAPGGEAALAAEAATAWPARQDSPAHAAVPAESP